MRFFLLIITALTLASCGRGVEFVVEGYVLEEGTGDPVANATVSLYEADCLLGCTESLAAQVVSGQDGFYRFELDRTSSSMSISASANDAFVGPREGLNFDAGNAVQDCKVIAKARFRVLFTGSAGYSYAFLHTNRLELNHPNPLATFIGNGAPQATTWMEVYGGYPADIGIYVSNSNGNPAGSYQWQILIPARDSMTLQAPF